MSKKVLGTVFGAGAIGVVTAVVIHQILKAKKERKAWEEFMDSLDDEEFEFEETCFEEENEDADMVYETICPETTSQETEEKVEEIKGAETAEVKTKESVEEKDTKKNKKGNK